MEYLGYIVSRNGVVIDPIKIQVVVYWPMPTNVKELKGFLGLTGYYKKFVPNMVRYVNPFIIDKRMMDFNGTRKLNKLFNTSCHDIFTGPSLT